MSIGDILLEMAFGLFIFFLGWFFTYKVGLPDDIVPFAILFGIILFGVVILTITKRRE